MKTLKTVLDFYINTSVCVALAVVSLCKISAVNFQLNIENSFYFFMFFATIAGYNFAKYFNLTKIRKRSFYTNHKLVSFISVLSCFGMLYFGWFLQVKTIFFLFFLALLNVFYTLPFNHYKSLRSISGIKIYIIALVWSCTTVLLPIVNYNAPLELDILLSFFQIFVFVLALLIPFEIRDLPKDVASLGTIPQKMGIRNTKYLGVLFLLIFFSLEFFKKENRFNPIYSYAIITAISLGFILFASKNQSNYYSSFWVESIPMFWWLLIVMYQIL